MHSLRGPGWGCGTKMANRGPPLRHSPFGGTDAPRTEPHTSRVKGCLSSTLWPSLTRSAVDGKVTSYGNCVTIGHGHVPVIREDTTVERVPPRSEKAQYISAQIHPGLRKQNVPATLRSGHGGGRCAPLALQGSLKTSRWESGQRGRGAAGPQAGK